MPHACSVSTEQALLDAQHQNIAAFSTLIRHACCLHIDEFLGHYIAMPHKASTCWSAIRKLIQSDQDSIEIDPTVSIG